jgi:two-component system, NarL family, sensor histidine kinase DevS
MGARSSLLDTFGDDFAWSLLEAAPDGIILVDRGGIVVFVSSQAAALFQASAQDLLGHTVEELVPDDVRSTHRALRSRFQAAPTVRSMGAGLLLRARRVDGTEFPVEISLSPITMGGEVFTVAALRDVTERVEVEQELRRSQSALREAGEVLLLAEDRERIARDLHDTVIQRLFGAGLQLQATLASTDARTRERLEATVVDLDDTIKELRSAIFALHGPSPALGGLRGRLVDILHDAAGPLGFEPRLQLDGPLESIDEQIAENLLAVLREALANAARHAQARSVRATISSGREVVLVVSDDGRGVPDEVHGGQGLANLARRAEELGGSFEIVRGPEQGSRLEWRVPNGAQPR